MLQQAPPAIGLKNSKPVAPKMNHGASSNSNFAAFSKGDMHLRSSAIVPDKSQSPAAVQPSSISESTNKLPGAGNAEGKDRVGRSNAPERSPASAKGSIEVISDPYPSIRMPAKSQQRASQAGTSLLIGRPGLQGRPDLPAGSASTAARGNGEKCVSWLARTGTIQAAAR